MSYEERLADRVRELLATEPDVIEKKMFGGLAFMVDGAMAVAAAGRGGLMVRIDPSRSEELGAVPGVEPVVMRGRELRGWVTVPSEELRTTSALQLWVDRGVAAGRAAPPRRARR